MNTTGKNTLSVDIVEGIPVISPNKVVFEDSSPQEYGGKEYDGFYVSYNSHNVDIYGSDTTAIVLGQMQKFFILDGDHSEALSRAAGKEKLDGCLAYFRAHTNQANRFSEIQ